MITRIRRSQPGMIFHLDRGEYTCEELCNDPDQNVMCSMSRRLNGWDNAAADSLCRSLECALISTQKLLSAEKWTEKF